MSKPKFSVGRFIAQDKQAFHKLWKNYVPSDSSPAILKSNWHAIQKGRLLAYRLHVSGKSIGFAFYHFSHYSKSTAPECYLADLYVDPAYRGQGGGRLLIEKLLKECRRKKSCRLWWVTQKSNARAQKLYDTFVKGIDYKRYIVKLSRR